MAISIRELKKDYVGPDGSVVAVVDVPTFDLGDGEHVALVGTSGSGKTTFLNLLAGILAADTGTIRYHFGASDGIPPVDVELMGLSEPRRDAFRGQHLGFIFQTHHLLPGFTALENVLLGMSFTRRAADPAWAKHLLAEVGLADRLHYRPAKLSVGQQQRVAVARALANRPRVVLADEPTGALDPAHAQQVLELIQRLCREVAASLLLVSHDPLISRQLQRQVALADINRAATGSVAIQ